MAIFSKNRNILLIYSQAGAHLKTKKNIYFSNRAFTQYLQTRKLFKSNHVKSAEHLKTNERFSKYFSNIINNQARWQSSQQSSQEKEIKSGLLKTSVLYSLSILFGGLFGIITGYWLMTDESQLDDENEATRSLTPISYESTKFVEHRDSKYENFPVSIHVYKYESCPYCSQITAYLDYFGFSYNVTEVDSYSKSEITSFTKARQLPIVVIIDKETGKRWHLANATAILSAFESLRNSKHIEFSNILDQYLPILKGKVIKTTINPYKYNVWNSELNDIETRRWINNQAIPVLKLNSMSNFKDLFELMNFYSMKSDWKLRYGTFKYLYVYYRNSLKTYNQYSSLEKQINQNKTPRELLHQVIDDWETNLDERPFISKTNKPNLADISMFGTMRAFEGCALFRESIAKHQKFKEWYERMQHCLLKGFTEENLKENKRGNFFSFLTSLSNNDETMGTEEKGKNDSELKSPSVNKPLVEKNLELVHKATNTETLVKTENLAPSEKTLLRVLAVNYIVYLIFFTYASWMGK